MLPSILTVLVVVSAALFLRAQYLGPEIQVYIFKPLTVLSILVMAALVQRPVSSRYKAIVMAALVFSLAGDVLLMLPADQFVLGLLCFAVAHVLYIVAFGSGRKPDFSSWTWLPLLVYGAAMFLLLAPDLGEMMMPVAVYVVIILIMAWQAWERWRLTRQRSALYAFVGAVLFVISDSALALNRFRIQYEAAAAVTWSTYVAAQWLIAFSVKGNTPS